MKRNIIVLAVSLLVLALVMSTGCAKAEFELSSLEITPSSVGTGDTATIKVDVANVGKAEGTYTVTLTIDGVLVETKNVMVAAETAQTVTFSVVKEVVGDYTVEVGGLTGTLRVVKPAEFVVTSLRVVPAPELGEGYYHVTVAIENVGALPGVYQLKCRVSDEEMAPIEVELTAGEKKTVTLTGAEATIRELAANYKNAKTDQREQVVSIAGLSETVTFPARPVVQPTYTPPTKPAVTPPPPAPAPVIKLQVLYVEPHMEEGSYAYVAGEVKNISDESLANVEAVVNFYTNEGRLMNTLRAVIEQTPLLAGKKSRFKVAGYVDATVARYSLRFQFLAGDVILHKVERE